MISGKTIAKNVGAMIVSQLTTWTLSFLLAIFLPRYLGAASMGAVSIATSIWTIMSVLIVFGMDIHLMKSVARDPTQVIELMATSLFVRTVFFIVSAILVTLYAFFMQYDRDLIVILVLEAVSFLFLAYSGVFASILVGLERMEFTSIASIVSKTILTGVTILLIFLDAGIYPIVAVNILSAFVSLTILSFALHRLYPLHFHVNLVSIRSIITNSSIYLVSALAMVVYQQIDKLFIAALVDTKTVGWYVTAVNLFSTTMFLPVVFATVIFPSLARSYASGDSKLNIIAQRSFDLMFILSVPVGLGLVVIGQPLVDMLYGSDFTPSGHILMLLGIVLIFTYLNTILGQLLISVDRTGWWNVVMIVAILVTLPIDLVMVPWTHQVYGNGALGGAFAFLITEFGMVVVAIFLLPRHTLQWSNVRTAVLTLFAGLIMMAASWWFRERFMLVSILVAMITYSGLVLLLRIIPQQELLLIKDAVLGVMARLRRHEESPASSGE